MKRNQQHPFDDFLKETLKGHQLVPREEARKAFLDEAATIVPARRGWFRWYYLPLLVVVISGIVALFFYPDGQEEQSFRMSESQSTFINSESSSNTDISSQETVKTDHDQSSLPLNPENKATRPESSSSKLNLPEEPTVPLSTGTITADVSVNAEPSFKPETAVIHDSQQDSVPDITQPIETITEIAQTGPVAQALADTTAVVPVVIKDKLSKPAETGPEPVFTTGIYYLPEYMFNTVEGGKYISNFGLDFTFYRGRTSIRTGAGISVSEGLTEKAVEYNEFLGTYNKLDSITFIYNESAGDFYANIHTSSENVWDSLSLYDSTDIVKRYTYLQVPLILGFDFWQKGRMTVGVRVGTIMSVMLKSKQLTGEYSAGANQVVGISQLSPDQVSVNWQAVGGINGTLMLNRRLYLEIEPQAKYYYQSIYEKSGYVKKPWSLGLRTAILYKF